MAGIFVKTFGCSANVGEGEIIKGLLKYAGHNIVDNINDSQIIILNICSVKGTNVALKEIKKVELTYLEKKLIITGCIDLKIISEIKKIVDASFISTNNINKIVEAVEKELLNIHAEILSKKNFERINLQRIRNNPVIGIVAISNGCDSACSFCSVKFIKGNTMSYSIEKIINEIQTCLNQGCKEIWLTSQDTGCYGHDIGTNLIELLEKIIDLKGDFKVRLGMANPKHVRHYYKELGMILKHEKMFKFLHIPVQSGNDYILDKMNRQHSVKEYLDIVNYLKKEIPEINIATDIICGFPGETKEQFEDTLKLLKLTKLSIVNISRFFLREKTMAAKMTDQITDDEKKNRSRIATKLFHKIARKENEKWIGWEGDVIIDEKGKNNSMIGRNHSYKPIVLKQNLNLGDKAKVRITNAGVFDLKGIILD